MKGPHGRGKGCDRQGSAGCPMVDRSLDASDEAAEIPSGRHHTHKLGCRPISGIRSMRLGGMVRFRLRWMRLCRTSVCLVGVDQKKVEHACDFLFPNVRYLAGRIWRDPTRPLAPGNRISYPCLTDRTISISMQIGRICGGRQKAAGRRVRWHSNVGHHLERCNLRYRGTDHLAAGPENARVEKRSGDAFFTGRLH